MYSAFVIFAVAVAAQIGDNAFEGFALPGIHARPYACRRGVKLEVHFEKYAVNRLLLSFFLLPALLLCVQLRQVYQSRLQRCLLPGFHARSHLLQYVYYFRQFHLRVI